MPLDDPFELASPSPSADMLLSVRLRFELWASVGWLLCAAGELVAPSGRRSKPSSEPVRRLRPSVWRADTADVVVGAIWVREPWAGLGRVVAVWLLCCWGAAAAILVGAERTVLEDG